MGDTKLKFSLEVDDKGSVKIKKFGKTVASAGTGGQNFGKKMKVAGAGVLSLAKSSGMAALKVAALGAALVTAAAGFTLKGAVTEFAQFESKLANVSTLVDTSVVDMDQLKQGIMALPAELGAATELTEGLYQALSAGVEPAKAIQFVGEAAKAAKAGLTDTFTAVDAGTTILNAFGKDVSQTGVVFDQMFSTVKLGKTTFGELSGTIGKLSPIAAAAGLSTDEMLASISALTAGGFATSEAVSRMATGLGAVIKPSGEASAMAEQLGLQFNAAALESQGLAGFLQSVQEKTGGNVEQMAQLFGGMESLSVMLALTGKQSKKFASDLTTIGTETGVVNEAFDKQKNTLTALWETFKNTIGKQAILIGEQLAPAIKDAITATTKWFEANRQLITKELTGWIQLVVQHIKDLKPAVTEIITKIGGWYKANKGLLSADLNSYLGNMVDAVVRLSESAELALVPFKAFGSILNGIGKGLAWVASKAVDFWDWMNKLPTAVQYAIMPFKAFRAVLDGIGKALSLVASKAAALWDKLKSLGKAKANVEFTGTGSSERPLGEKIDEMEGRLDGFKVAAEQGLNMNVSFMGDMGDGDEALSSVFNKAEAGFRRLQGLAELSASFRLGSNRENQGEINAAIQAKSEDQKKLGEMFMTNPGMMGGAMGLIKNQQAHDAKINSLMGNYVSGVMPAGGFMDIGAAPGLKSWSEKKAEKEGMGSYASGTGPAGLPRDGVYYGHKGEIVKNPSESDAERRGGSGPTYHIHINSTLGDERSMREAAAIIHQELKKYERRVGA